MKHPTLFEGVDVELGGGLAHVLSKAYSRLDDVRKTNIAVAVVISEILKTMIGPKGMSKMLVTETGDVLVTSSGRAMLERLRVSHPVARGLVDVARVQGELTGDGTKTAVVVAGALLREAEKLMDQKVHVTTIIEGYRKAAVKAVEVLERLAIRTSAENEEVIRSVARTFLRGRFNEDVQDHVADLMLKAVLLTHKGGKDASIEDEVCFVKKAGSDVSASELIRGVVICREKPHPRMPSKMTNVKVALLNCSLQPFLRKSEEWKKEYLIGEEGRLAAFIKGESEIYREIVGRVKRVGVSAVFCRKRISEKLVSCFASEGLLAFELVSEEDIARLTRATGGRVVSYVNDLTERDLGVARLVEFRKIAGDEVLVVEGGEGSTAVTLLLRGGTTEAVEELERMTRNGLKALSLALKDGRILPGGGATEVEVSRELRSFSRAFTGKEQLAIEAFAKAIETIPRIIAENAGLKASDVLPDLYAKHAAGGRNFGVDVVKREVVDTVKAGLFDVFEVKRRAILAAYEFATMILRVDDAVVAKTSELRKMEEEKVKERKRFLDEKIRKVLGKDEELMKVSKKLTSLSPALD
ncbi:MAG: thermosome subunit alpha [Candidatus Jordarchaeales archaeon]